MTEDRVIHGARGQMILLTVGAGVFTILNFAARDDLVAQGGMAALVGYAGPLFWLACGGAGLFRAIYLPILTLRSDGFSIDGRLWPPKTIAWSEVDGFYLRKVGLLTRMVGYQFRATQEAQGGFLPTRRADGYLIDHWTVPAAELADLMQSRLEASRQ